MALARLLGATAALAGGVYAHSKDYNSGMGALGVVWPPDRAWSEADARTAPCGNVDGVANRTDFSLSSHTHICHASRGTQLTGL